MSLRFRGKYRYGTSSVVETPSVERPNGGESQDRLAIDRMAVGAVSGTARLRCRSARRRPPSGGTRGLDRRARLGSRRRRGVCSRQPRPLTTDRSAATNGTALARIDRVATHLEADRHGSTAPGVLPGTRPRCAGVSRPSRSSPIPPGSAPWVLSAGRIRFARSPARRKSDRSGAVIDRRPTDGTGIDSYSEPGLVVKV